MKLSPSAANLIAKSPNPEETAKLLMRAFEQTQRMEIAVAMVREWIRPKRYSAENSDVETLVKAKVSPELAKKLASKFGDVVTRADFRYRESETMFPEESLRYSVDELIGPTGDQSREDFGELARQYADIWNLVEDVPARETDWADQELFGTGVVLDHDNVWTVVLHPYSAGGVAIKGKMFCDCGWVPYEQEGLQYASQAWAEGNIPIPNKGQFPVLYAKGEWREEKCTRCKLGKRWRNSETQKISYRPPSSLARSEKPIGTHESLRSLIADYKSDLTGDEKKKLNRSAGAIRRHHGEHAVGRLHEMAEDTLKMLKDAETDEAKNALAKRLAGISYILGKIDAENPVATPESGAGEIQEKNLKSDDSVKYQPISCELHAPGQPIAQRIASYTEGDEIISRVLKIQAQERDLEDKMTKAYGESLKAGLRKSGLRARAPRNPRTASGIKAKQKYEKALEEAEAEFQKYRIAQSEYLDFRNSRAKRVVEAIGIPEELRTRFAIRNQEAWRSSDGLITDDDIVPTTEIRQRVDLASDFIRAITKKSTNLNSVFLERLPSGGRAHCKGDLSIHISDGNDPSVAAHELGHWLQNSDGEINDATQEFLRHRFGNEIPVRLKDLFGESYDDNEFGRRDDFEKTFSHHTYGKNMAYYVGKVYEGRDSTEIISMGIEELYNHPVEFATNDPEYFKFIVGVLNGALRTGRREK